MFTYNIRFEVIAQRKPDYYFPQRLVKPKASSSSFIDLPYLVRHRIYVLAGLMRFCPINLNQEGPGSRICVGLDDEPLSYVCFFESRKNLGHSYTIDCIPRLPLSAATLFTAVRL